MSLTQVAQPFPIFTDTDGKPLDDGYIYVGITNDNPETNPIAVYWDADFTIPAAQPIRTINGYPSQNGAPGVLYANSQFSITVRDKHGRLVIYHPVGFGVNPTAVTGTVQTDKFQGDSVTTTFYLTKDPLSINNTYVFVDGVYQSKNTYNVVLNALTFTEAPPISSDPANSYNIEVVSAEAVALGAGQASLIIYQAPSSTVSRYVSDKLAERRSAADYGYIGELVDNLPHVEGGAGCYFIAGGKSAYGDGGQGLFIFDTNDLSTEISADSLQGMYVAPDSDPTGASGAWKRSEVVNGLLYAKSAWFGLTTTALEAAAAMMPVGATLEVAPGEYEDVVIDESDIILKLSDSVTFKTSDGALTPAIQFNTCSNVKVIGDIIADGNKANNPNAYTDPNVGYEYATVGFVNCDDCKFGDVKVTDAWHDGVNVENSEESYWGDIYTKDHKNRGFLAYEGCLNVHFKDIKSEGPGNSHGIRIGGSSTANASYCFFGDLIAHGGNHAGVIVEAHADNIHYKTIEAYDNDNNGCKFTDSSYIYGDRVICKGNQLNGFAVLASTQDMFDIHPGEVICDGNALDTGSEYNGVQLSGIDGYTLDTIHFLSIESNNNGNGTQGGSGFVIQNSNDAGSTVKNVTIGRINTIGNYKHGFVLDDLRDVINIKVGDLDSVNNNQMAGTGADIRIENNIQGIQIANMDVGTVSQRPTANTCKSLKYDAYGGGMEFHIAQNEFDLTDNAGAYSQWLNAIPGNGVIFKGITSRVTETVVISGGTVWQCGQAANHDRWGNAGALAVGSIQNMANYDGTDVGPTFFGSSLSIRIYPDAGTFTDGKVRSTLVYERLIDGES